jgi:hypothetical protein
MTIRFRMALSLALLLITPAAHAGLRKQCRLTCGPAISTCIAGGGRVAKCTRQVRAQCRHQGLQVCAPPTTTTLPPPPPTTTTTSTTFHMGTTTTQPQVSRFTPYAGRWEFTGSIAVNTCPNTTAGLQDDVTITVQVGGGATATADSIGPGVVFAGSFDDTNHVMVMGATFLQSGCTVRAAFDMVDPITVPEAGGVGLSLDCGLPACQAIWVGTWVRL